MKRILLLVLASLLLAGCTSQPGQNGTEAVREPERLVVYTCLEEEVYAPLVEEFRNSSGIWVQVEHGSAVEIAAKSNDGNCDVLLGCGPDLIDADSEKFPGGSSLLSLRPMVLVFNPRLVRRNLPDAWENLISAAWKGQIAFADPLTEDFSRSVLCVLWELFGEDGVAAFAANVDVMPQDAAEAASLVAEGRYCLAVVPEDTALWQVAAGAALSVVYPRDGSFAAADCVAIPAAAPHPENAAAFRDFLCSERTQNFCAEYQFRSTDVPNGTAPVDTQRQPEILAAWQQARGDGT